MLTLTQIESDFANIKMLMNICDSQRESVLLSLKAATSPELYLDSYAVLKKEKDRLIKELNALMKILDSSILPGSTDSCITLTEEEIQQQPQTLQPSKYSYLSVKESRKNTGDERSLVRIFQADVSKPVLEFSLEHKEDKTYPFGGFAQRVKKAYLPGANEPTLAVKIYKNDIFRGNAIHESRVAMRAAHCYKLLGRKGLSYRSNGKQFIVTDFLKGADLQRADQKQIQNIPIPERIIMAMSLLEELQILHEQGLIHNDIKPDNVMINWGELNFVDMDSVHLKDETPFYGMVHMHTFKFLDAQTSRDLAQGQKDSHLKFNERTDLYALGLTLAYLFQDVYIPKEKENEINLNGGSQTYKYKSVSLHHGPKYAENPGVQRLIKQMVFPEKLLPATAKDYIEAFLAVLKTYQGYENYLKKGNNFAPPCIAPSRGDTVKAFQEIETELLGFKNIIGDANNNAQKLKPKGFGNP